ncbi:MAG TPA: secretin N-terminal domain-containing protein [Verrucomicrobiae bacterium]|nr:secretin N-terminal domain-containing protein [Verrucomicrobiae bacterium]
MKTTLLTLTALGAAGLLYTAAAQDNNNNTPPPEQPAPPAEAGNAAPVPADAPVVTQPGTDAAPAPTDQMPAPPTGDAPAADNGDNNNAARTSQVILPSEPLGSERAKLSSNFTPPEATGTNSDELRLNFKNAPLEMVLNYLSDAAGFIIVLDTQVRGTVSVISGQPVTKDEAVDLLNSVLNKNGYAAIRDGRTLTIVDKNDAKTRDIPVRVESDPNKIPKNAEIVTQIIPIRFVEARQLVSDLSSFVSPQATVVANEAGNSIVITDTQQNIRHLAEIIKAIDSSAEAETEIRVFTLKYASPTDVATELGNVFPSSTSGSGTQSPIRFGGQGGGGGGFFARMMGGGGGGGGQAAAGGSSADRIKKATQVTAVADSRIQAVIVTAPKDMMEQIGDMMKELDVPSQRDQKVYVFHMDNADPQQAAQVLQGMFQSSSTSRSGSSSSSQNSALQTRAINNATTTSSSSSSSSGFGSTGGGGGRGGSGGGF